MADYIVNELQQALSALREGFQMSVEYHINNALREHKQRLTKRAADSLKAGGKTAKRKVVKAKVIRPAKSR